MCADEGKRRVGYIGAGAVFGRWVQSGWEYSVEDNGNERYIPGRSGID